MRPALPLLPLLALACTSGPCAAPEAPAADPPGDGEDEQWAPAEHQKGNARWKDTGVYVDGQLVGVLAFGELPTTLQPLWFTEEVSAPKRPGSDDPGFRLVKQRRYRFTDYLSALGVRVESVRELHVLGPRFSETIVVRGTELAARGQDFLFRFGGEVWGKAIPVVPEGFGNGRTPDKVSGVLVYVEKEPPELVRNEGMRLGGRIVTGVPYLGEPVRGGVRVYADDRLALVIKRRELDGANADPQGGFALAGFLAAQGLAPERYAEAWIIHGERRRQRLDRAALARARFTAAPQARGELLLDGQPTQALALHTLPVPPDRMPQILPAEEPDLAALSD